MFALPFLDSGDRMSTLPKDELSAKLAGWHARLNAQSTLPRMAHRRNTAIYSLVSYVNNATGCYLSNNLEAIPLFIERCRDHIRRFKAAEYDTYYALVTEYLKDVEEFLRRHGINHIPANGR